MQRRNGGKDRDHPSSFAGGKSSLAAKIGDASLFGGGTLTRKLAGGKIGGASFVT